MSDWDITKHTKKVMCILDIFSEGIHYEIIPNENDFQGWDVRLLEEYPETVIRYGKVAI